MTREHIEFVLSEYSTDALAGKLLELFDEEAASYQHTINKLNKALSENKGEWIPVSKRLPEIHQDVLLELRSGEMLTGFKAELEPYFYVIGLDGCYVEPENVIAWQPLPEPYKKGE